MGISSFSLICLISLLAYSVSQRTDQTWTPTTTRLSATNASRREDSDSWPEFYVGVWAVELGESQVSIHNSQLLKTGYHYAAMFGNIRWFLWFYGCSCISMDVHELLWIFIGFHRFVLVSWVYTSCIIFHKFLAIFKVFYWFPLFSDFIDSIIYFRFPCICCSASRMCVLLFGIGFHAFMGVP